MKKKNKVDILQQDLENRIPHNIFSKLLRFHTFVGIRLRRDQQDEHGKKG